MWFLPISVFSLAREKHIQILNDTGIVSEQSGPTVNSILRMPPTTCRGSRLDKGDGRGSLLSQIWEGSQRDKYSLRPQVRREKADWLVPQESVIL